MNKHKRYIPQRKKRYSKRHAQSHLPVVAPSVPAVAALQASEAQLVTHDEHLLERSRTQWQFGDWESLAQLSRDTLQHHPDRAKLALLAAAGLLQQGEAETARQFIRLAQDWGCNKKLISQILVAGVYNSLGRVAAAANNESKALKHFTQAVQDSNADNRLICQARSVRELTHMGLLPQAAGLIKKELHELNQEHKPTKLASQITILQTELDLLHHELSLAQQRQQLYKGSSTREAHGEEHIVFSLQEELKKKSVSQLGQDLWVLEKTNYKREGFFVEFGATDGVLLSNTWLLEKEFGWQGICAEPNPKFYAQLQKNRQCKVSDQYIGSQTGQRVEFILADAFGGSEEFAKDDRHKEKREAYRNAGHVITCTAISLNDFLEQHQAPNDIDYMSVDTEGSEYDLLSKFPFEKWNIRFLTVEHNFTDQRAKIRALLESHGYSFIEQQWDDWYEKVSNG